MQNVRLVMCFGLVMLLSSCVTAPRYQAAKNSTQLWQYTNPGLAYAQAQREQKPVFIYWGAVWCPPCNELKSNLFSKPQFAEILQSTVSVYLDGDTDIAQTYGDKLNVSSYPTMLMLDPSGKEVIRIVDPIGIDEFQSLFRRAMLKLKPEKARIAAVLSGAGSDDDFRILATTDASELSTQDGSLFRQLAERTPEHLAKERSLLLLKALTYTIDKEGGSEISEDRSWAVKPLIDLLDDDSRLAQNFFTFRAKDMKAWLGTMAFENTIEKQWLENAHLATADKTRSITSRLWSFLPQIELNASKMTDEQKASIQEQILALHSQTKNHYEQHAATSAAASLLLLLGNVRQARIMLTTALQSPQVNMPWYYEASLADLEAREGNVSDALKWSRRAKQSAKGLATTIQWDAMDILLNLKLAPNATEQIAQMLTDFYEELFRRPDGFLGRNRIYATKIAKALASDKTRYQSIISKFAERCKTLRDDAKSLCEQYFSQM